MSIVIFATIPLITVPTGDLIYGKLPMSVKGDNAGRITTSIRIMVCLVSAYVSVAVPDFVSAISFTGCLCVASLSFVYPPLVHLVLRYKFCRQKKNRIFCSDILLLLWGIAATAVSTTLTFQSMMMKMQSDTEDKGEMKEWAWIPGMPESIKLWKISGKRNGQFVLKIKKLTSIAKQSLYYIHHVEKPWSGLGLK